MEDKMLKENLPTIVSDLNNLTTNTISAEVIKSDDFNAKYTMLTAAIKQLEELKSEVDAAMKETLLSQYMSTGEGSITTEGHIFSYIPGSTRESIDAKRLKEEDPELYKKYVRVSTLKDSVRVSTPKKDNK